MALLHSPRITRSQAAAGAAEMQAAAVDVELEGDSSAARRGGRGEAATEAAALQAALKEIRELREERQRERESFRRREEEFGTFVRQREEELRRLEDRLRQNVSGESLPNLFDRAGVAPANIKAKPDVFDGSGPLREFLTQFELVARANGWNSETKALMLATNLRGKARSVLEGLEGEFSYGEVRSRLELRFGEQGLFQSYYVQFTSRRQRGGEDFAALGADLERLSRLAYPECAHEIREKIACAQFIAALSDGFVRRTLQLENVTSLRAAVERAKTVRLIQENSFRAGGESCSFREFGGRAEARPSSGSGGGKDVRNGSRAGGEPKGAQSRKADENKKEKECWKCGKKGHFRFECPANLSGNRG